MTDRDWTEPLALSGMTATVGQARVTCRAAPPAWEIAGDIAAFVSAFPAREIGLGGALDGGDTILRLARDRAIWLPDTGSLDEGWHAAGWAALPVSDAWTILALTGPGATDLIRQHLALDLIDGSPSAAAMLAGHRILLLRDCDGWQLWCSAPEAWAIWRWLTGGAATATAG